MAINSILFSSVFGGANSLGFPAAAPPASGLDTGPCSGRPGRVRCLGVCNATEHNTEEEDKVTHQLSSFTRRDDKDYHCEGCGERKKNKDFFLGQADYSISLTSVFFFIIIMISFL